jgi:hypothetical protein
VRTGFPDPTGSTFCHRCIAQLVVTLASKGEVPSSNLTDADGGRGYVVCVRIAYGLSQKKKKRSTRGRGRLACGELRSMVRGMSEIGHGICGDRHEAQ